MPTALSPLPLPSSIVLETPAVLRQLTKAHRHLAELKGVAGTIPNESILIDTLALQEAKDSSEVENIITTQDELFRGDPLDAEFPTSAAKEVYGHASALKKGFARIQSQKFIRLEDVLAIQSTLMESQRVGLRTAPGTVLKDQASGKVIYEPPQDRDVIVSLMGNFLDYFHREDGPDTPDPLVRMAILHHQFESIHPFYDGNGRTGRILNLLHLVLHGLLDIPVLYLSRFIVQNKSPYYRYLQDTRESNNWEPWVIYMLRAVEETSRETICQVRAIRDLMASTKQRLRAELPKLYSQDLLNNLFRHPYTKIEFIERDLQVTRPTATRYLDLLNQAGLVKKVKTGRSNFYINEALVALLSK